MVDERDLIEAMAAGCPLVGSAVEELLLACAHAGAASERRARLVAALDRSPEPREALDVARVHGVNRP